MTIICIMLIADAFHGQQPVSIHSFTDSQAVLLEQKFSSLPRGACSQAYTYTFPLVNYTR